MYVQVSTEHSRRSGKGTQCDKLKKSFGVRHISSGDVLRDHVKRGTDLGKEAKTSARVAQGGGPPR